ncbi:putative nicotinate-nucleotide adenylyltransferase [Latilactobacillus sakei]|jgi:nicotinate-nucleotide adenylyltransferase|uniref:Probable nicotinate-nucleotide adenylyltransferase n=1 Tax=Latilactobacillus sakei TaxID=1599 RepID=A0A094Y074_LATSK|nr:nicotinate-nucleotide adenylyltransferase [Latilactobacillus sakei]ARJ71583.1 nicotinate-nicotinamide nucleotide adenylyltransferase [Latilactobacillus sakei]AST83946.1 nicotinate-nicotinamide nucleotide adenylyltransferase [Latilactobacillus sakei]AWZ41887.1 nicotinate-nucleotide adenylyltransferase [Latilactobacillus sakei]AWZ44597.1 nicotinate-nucleotide adenylyltransferase [Latilactobacillus sakei]AWZ46945.1 nicotinate-nucleotide adenylyltransferase [Latilactobacillus sakei]
MQNATLKKVHGVSESKPSVLVVEDKQRQQVGIMGGTFNPPHLGHLIMAEQVGTQLGLDKVLFMPDATPPHVDTKKTLPAKHRVEMVKRAIADNPLFELSMAEIERGGVSYTYDTIVALKKQYPNTDFYFIIGGDMVDYLPTWHRIDDLVQLVQFVGIQRTGYSRQTPYPVLWVDAPLVDISSTQIRNKVQQGCSIRYLVPTKVADYIEEEGLYRE